MLALWWMLVLSARCSGADEIPPIPLDRAEQSSTIGTNGVAINAIDGKLNIGSCTIKEDPAWLRVYFKSFSNVEHVVIDKGFSNDASCVYTVSVYKGEVETVCGTYTGKADGFYSNEAVQCGGKEGDSVRLKRTGCTGSLEVVEIKLYGQGKY